MKYYDIDQNELNEGDRVILTIYGIGSGETEIVKHNDELCIYEPSQGYYPLKNAANLRNIILQKIKR